MRTTLAGRNPYVAVLNIRLYSQCLTYASTVTKLAAPAAHRRAWMPMGFVPPGCPVRTSGSGGRAIQVWCMPCIRISSPHSSDCVTVWYRFVPM